MDFFETREKYRRKEYRIYVRLVTRAVVFALLLWIGWQWGNYDQKNFYENLSKFYKILLEFVPSRDFLSPPVSRIPLGPKTKPPGAPD